MRRLYHTTAACCDSDVSNDGEATLHPMWDEFVIAQPTDEAGVVNLPSETRLVSG